MTSAPDDQRPDLPALRDAMRQHGYDDALQRRLMCDNWLSALERIWH